jgi:PKD repeat protein
MSTRTLVLLSCVVGMGLLVLALASCALFNKLPVAGFTIGPSTTGPAPFPVTLSAAPSSDPDGEIKTYSWDYGDGAQGSGKSVAHTYNAVGTYTIILTVIDNWDAADVAAKTVYVTAAEPAGPAASFTVSPTSGTSPLTVSFDASASTYAGGAISSYEWAFGDGGTWTGKTAQHTYFSSGSKTFTVTLTVRGTDNKTGTATKSITVTVSGGGGTPVAGSPSARFDATPTIGVAPFRVEFDPSDSEAAEGRTLTNFVWSFGDGESGYSMNPTVVPHTYVTAKASEVFSAMLLVLDNENADDSIVKTIKVYNYQPVAGFEIANPPGGEEGGVPPLFYATSGAIPSDRWVADDVYYGNLGIATINVTVWIRSREIGTADTRDERWFTLTAPASGLQKDLRTATGSALSGTPGKPTGYDKHNFSYDPEGQTWVGAPPIWFGGNQSWGIKTLTVDWDDGAPVGVAYDAPGNADNVVGHTYTFSPGATSTAVPKTITVTATDYLGAKATWTRTIWLKSNSESTGEP